ncbi:MAG: hypothetical protein WKF87_12060 [Chryseolinea sp.]
MSNAGYWLECTTRWFREIFWANDNGDCSALPGHTRFHLAAADKSLKTFAIMGPSDALALNTEPARLAN